MANVMKLAWIEVAGETGGNLCVVLSEPLIFLSIGQNDSRAKSCYRAMIVGLCCLYATLIHAPVFPWHALAIESAMP